MQTLKKFSGSTTVPAKNATYSFVDCADGTIRKAVLGTDYANVKGFLVAMSRFANSNNLTVNRYIHPDGVAVEFQLVSNSAPVAAETSETENSDTF